MNIKKILTVILLTSTIMALFSFKNQQSKSSIVVNDKKIKDFEDNYKVAHEWGKEKWSKWWEQVNKEERASLQEYVGYSADINKYLREERGVLDKAIEASLVTEIRLIDQALEKGKIPETIFVYRRARESMFGLEKSTLRDEKSDDKKINFATLEKIKSQFENKEFIEYGFLSTSLSKIPSGFSPITHSILLKIKVPQGLNGGYLSMEINDETETEILIARGYKIKYESFSRIIDHNHYVVKVEASLRNDAF